MEYIPKKQGRVATITAFSLLLVACVFFGLGSMLSWRWIYQSAGMILLVFSIMLLTRFCLHTYVYRIEKGAEGDSCEELVVEEVNKRATKTVCRAKLSGLREIIEINRQNRALVRKRETNRGNHAFYYLPDIALKRSFVLVFDGEIIYGAGCEGYVHLVADEALLALLRQYLPTPNADTPPISPT